MWQVGPSQGAQLGKEICPQEGVNTEEPFPAGHLKFCITQLDPLPCEGSLGEWSPILAPLVLGE